MEIENEYSDFGAYIKQLREGRGLSQDDLARQLDLSRVSVANIEGGRQRVLLHQAVQLAKALHFSLGDFQSATIKRSIDQKISQRSNEGESKLRAALSEVRREA